MLRLTFVLLALVATARAELKWDKPIQEFHRAPNDGHVEAAFTFTNVGTTPVEITKARPSCGCTTARREKKTYAPGEKGAITAKFVFGSRTGPQRKTISVTTDDGAEIVLDLRVWISESLTLAPALVWWKVGALPEAKTVQLTAAEGRKVGIKSVVSSNPKFAAKVETVAVGKQYALKVTPADTVAKEAATLTIETDFPPDAPQRHVVHVRIK